MIDLYASQPHYAEHLWPIWRALPADVRGEAAAPFSGAWWATHARRRRVRTPLGWPVLVAGFADAQAMRGRPIVYVEHGAGQTYAGDPVTARHGSYAGGAGLDHVGLFIAPSETVADRWRAVYGAPVAVVGCPRLDPWHLGMRGEHTARPTVAFAFHWSCALVAETLPALPHYERRLPEIIDAWQALGWQVWGGGHPREDGRWTRLWSRLGVQRVSTAQILDSADLLVADNTSLLYEFASLDRPTVVLNAPWYRRTIEHGLRFWSLVPGVQIDDPDALACLDLDAVIADESMRRSRRQIIGQVYAHRDGFASLRAAAAITRWEAVRG